ncbi:MAG: molecular chaperone DnaJ [Deltaproteobacteria bacterium]
MATKRDYYEVLGVAKDASQGDIKRAYRKLARRHHPDLNPGSKESEDKFKELQQAYEILSKEDKRRAYDSYGSSPFQRGGAGQRGANPEHPGGYSQQYSPHEVNLEDLFGGGFDDIFRDPAAPQKRGRDIEYQIEIDFETAIRGGSRDISLTREAMCGVCAGTGVNPGGAAKTCPQCKGSGRLNFTGIFGIGKACNACSGTGKSPDPCRNCGAKGRIPQSETISVRIPSGVDSGSKIRVPGKGQEAASSVGDLYLRIKVSPHPIFDREDGDIYVELPVTFYEAALGAQIQVPTIDGAAVVVTIPSGVQNGTKLRLRGKGAPNIKTKERGDQYVLVKIVMPEHLSESAKRKFEELQKASSYNPREFLEKYMR